MELILKTIICLIVCISITIFGCMYYKMWQADKKNTIIPPIIVGIYALGMVVMVCLVKIMF